MIVEIFESGLETYVGYYYLVAGWGQTDALNVAPKPLLFQPLCNALGKHASTCIDVEYSHRCAQLHSVFKTTSFGEYGPSLQAY